MMTKVGRFVAIGVVAVLTDSRAAAEASPAQSSAPAAAQAPAPTEMRMYYMVFLRRGPAWTAAATPEATKVSQGHRANIDRLTKEGLMVVAGPFEGTSGDRALAGIFILRVDSMEAGKAAVDTDPAVKAGRFVYEIVPWWGPASLRY
jgi:uncharacterized protein YciI